MILTILVFLIILSILVLIHEAGHFFVAKKMGIKVEEFGFGFPPRAWSKKIGETIYSINWLPIGGFVKLYGEDEAGAGRITTNSESRQEQKRDVARAFFSRSAGQRAAVIVAGVVMNAILTIVIFYIYLAFTNFHSILPCVSKTKLVFVNEQRHCDVVITQVAKDSPAEKAGIQPPAKIVSVNYAPVADAGSFQEYILSHKGQSVEITWEEIKTKQIHSSAIIPRVQAPKNQGSLGVAFDPQIYIDLSYDTFAQKLFSGITHPINLLIFQFDAIGSLFHQSVVTKDIGPIAKNVSGPIGIASFVGMIIQNPNLKESILGLLNLTGLLSLSLAFFNVLPIPALDGGRLFFILIEVIRRKKINPELEGKINTAFMAALLALVLLVTYKDIIQLIKGPM